jgi:HPt (histidine-containing phosphotransfer) domain-containing protein
MSHSNNKSDCAMNLEIALAHVDDDRQFLAELAEMFVADYPHLLDEAKISIQQGDHAGLERTAHTLQGRLAFFGVDKARDKALKLETMGRTENLLPAAAALAELETDMKDILPEFVALYREPNA